MLRRMPLLLLTLALVICWSAPAALAEDPPAKKKIEPPADPKVAIGVLDLELQPQRQAELADTLESWMLALETAVEASSKAKLALRSTTDPQAKEEASNRVAVLAKERKDLIDRVLRVIGEFETKGGDATTQRKYVEAVGDVQADLAEAKGWTEVVWAWIKSEQGGLRWAKQLGLFLLILFGFRIVANIVGGIVRRSLDAMGRTPELLRNFLANTSRNVIFLIGLVVALSQLGMDIGPMLAAIGGAGFVIGFALQSTLSNFAAGVMILLYRPYEIGDIVTVSGTTGKVKAMTLVSTTVITPDNQVIVVPNSNIWGDVITNVTGSDTRRVDLVFGIGYDDDMDKAQALLEEIATSHPMVLDTPETVVKVGTLNASSVDYVVRPWCKTGDYWDVYWDLTRQVKERFDAEGISIPYPQTDIHIHQAGPAAE